MSAEPTRCDCGHEPTTHDPRRDNPAWCPVYARRTPMLPWHNGMMTFSTLQPDGSVKVTRWPCIGCGKVDK